MTFNTHLLNKGNYIPGGKMTKYWAIPVEPHGFQMGSICLKSALLHAHGRYSNVFYTGC